MTKAIIFHLDGCFGAADEVGEQLFAPTFATIAGFSGESVLAIRLVSSLAPPNCARTEFSESKS
jgi:hypothetical protein